MRRSLGLIAAVAIAVLLLLSVYTVSETEQAILTQFGEPVGGTVTRAGLHFRAPLVQLVHRFDKRWLEFEGSPNQIPTKDKKYIWVETYARWRIIDPLKFYQNVGDERGAQSRLDDIIDGQTRNAVASFDLLEIVRSTNRGFQVTEELSGIGSAEAMAPVRTGRSAIAKIVLEKAAQITPSFGIEVEDVRFLRLNYIDTVQQKVFERMISERKRIAERSRSEGQGKAAEIRGQKERDVLAASSEGYKQAQEKKGAADATSTAIYARAYGRDPEFYQFMKSMETLQSSLDEKSWLLLSTDSELLKYLKDSGGR
ncbi:MAG TPA: protease modulator HflC [Vicinamibacteria bacterium]